MNRHIKEIERNKKFYKNRIYDPINNPEQFKFYPNIRGINKTPFKVLEYRGASDCSVEFLDEYHYIIKHTKIYTIEINGVRNPYQKTIFNVGYIGEIDKNKYPAKDSNKSYRIWKGILDRCYNPKTKSKYYLDNISVSKSWLCYANFIPWFERNYFQLGNYEMHIDKDILGNMKYSSKYCVFVPKEINMSLIGKKNDDEIQLYYIKKSKKYRATVSRKFLYNDRIMKEFNNKENAIKWYKNKINIYLKELANLFKNEFINQYGIKSYENNDYRFKEVIERISNWYK